MVGALLLGQENHSQHLVPGRRLPSPDFKLPRRLMHKHFYAGNHFGTRSPRQLHQTRLRWIVNHLENVTSFDFVLIKR